MSIYSGFRFVLHEHKALRAGLHYDLRFEDLHNKNIVHSFAIPKSLFDNDRTIIYKVNDHTPDWLDKEYVKNKVNLKIVDSGLLDYKVYKPSKYFELDFHGNKLSGIYKIWKQWNNKRLDSWLFYK